MTNTKKNNKRKILRYIFIILCFSVLLFSLYTLFKWNIDNFKSRQINKKIEKETNINISNKQGKLINPPNNKNSNYYYYAKFKFYQVDFSILSSKNSDTVGFIHIKNTNINYPVVQASNNKYYLKHSFNKTENSAGWIFMDYRNNISNLDDNTIIYGHSRIDGTMFGSLKKTLSSSWQKNKDNYVIYLSTLKENMIFQIFSIYNIKRENYYIKSNFNSSIEKRLWLDTMKKRNTSIIDTEVNVNDKILTLSTCKNRQGERLVVQAKLIKKQNR